MNVLKLLLLGEAAKENQYLNEFAKFSTLTSRFFKSDVARKLMTNVCNLLVEERFLPAALRKFSLANCSTVIKKNLACCINDCVP